MKALLAIALLASSTAFAHGSSHPPQTGSDGGSVMDATVVPRAIIWPNDRLWQRVDGVILVCPFNAKISDYQWRDFECYVEQGKVKVDRWLPLQDYKIDGMVLKSYEYRFTGSGGYKQLIVYYGPATPVAAGLKTEATVVSPSFTGPITIQADKVVVQRRKP